MKFLCKQKSRLEHKIDSIVFKLTYSKYKKTGCITSKGGSTPEGPFTMTR